MLQEAFGDNALIQRKVFFIVQTLQERTNICRRRWAFWTIVDKHNTGKQQKFARLSLQIVAKLSTMFVS
jgi:hypothetical protein